MNTTVAKTQMPTAGYGAALWRGLRSFALLRESWVGMVGAFLVGLAHGPDLCPPGNPFGLHGGYSDGAFGRVSPRLGG